MKSFSTFVICVIVLGASFVLSQETAQSPNFTLQMSATATLPAGMMIPVVLQNTLDSKKVKPGDPVKLELMAAIKGPDGKVAVPNTAKLSGHVVEAVGRNKGQTDSRLAIVVDRMEWKNGNMPLHAVFSQAAFPAPKRTANDRGDSASKILILPGSKERPTMSSNSAIGGGGSGDPSPFDETWVENSADPQIGTVLVSKTRNIVLPMGTRLIIVQTSPGQ